MALVRLPSPHNVTNNCTPNNAKRIQGYLFDRRIEVPIKCVEGKLYARLSCHIYNTPADYHQLAKALKF
jgi:isopenicillin-N epimerase